MALDIPYKRVGLRVEHTVTNTIYTLPATPSGANAVLVQTITADVRYTEDGSSPSATHGGLIIHDHDAVLISLQRFSEVAFFRSASTDAPMTFQFVKVENRW